MSANIYWKPDVQDGKILNIPAPNTFMNRMERAGLELPCTLSEDDILVLKGMSACYEGENNPFEQLIERINQSGPIKVWAVY